MITLREDKALSTLAEKREAQHKKKIKHQDAWNIPALPVSARSLIKKPR
jgi:hypothetical protein